MDAESYNRIKESPEAEPRAVYRRTNSYGNEQLLLCVSGQYRRLENFVSVIFLTDAETDTGYHGDEVGIMVEGRAYWIHAGMVTYVRRDQMGEKVAKLSKDAMKKVHRAMKQALGMENRPRDGAHEPPEPDYKALYEGLLDAIRNGAMK